MNAELIARAIADAIKKMNVPVGVSARHIHLSQEDARVLLGHELRPMKELMGGQYATQDTVTIVGENSIEKVRVLGPVRKQTQVEISATDALKLKLKPPIRESGDLEGSAPIKIIGKAGTLNLKAGCIIAARHIHMPPGRGYNDGDIVSVEVPGQRGLILKNVKVRVDESFTLEMHIDTDEANACGLKTGDKVRIL